MLSTLGLLAVAATASVAAGSSSARAKVLVLKEFDLTQSKNHLTEHSPLTLRYMAINTGSLPAFNVKLVEDFSVDQWIVANPNGGAVIEESDGLLHLTKEFAELSPSANETFSVTLTPKLAGPLKSTGALVTYKYENSTAVNVETEDLDSGKSVDEEFRFITVTSRSSGPGVNEILTTAAFNKLVSFENAEVYHSLASWAAFAVIAWAFYNWRSAAGSKAAPSKKRL